MPSGFSSGRDGIWFPAPGKLAIFVTVVLPLLYLLSTFLIREYVLINIYFTEDHVLHGPDFDVFILNLNNSFFWILLGMMFIAFPFYTYIFPYICRKYHRTYFKDIVIEYQYVKTILWASISLLLIFNLIPLLTSISKDLPLPFFHDIISIINDEHRDSLRFLGAGLILIVSAALFDITMLLIRMDFRLEFAKGCLELLSKKKDEVEKINYLMKALESYNKYIRKRLKISIDFSEIYFKIINSSTKDRCESIEVVCKAFDGDKLGVLNHLLRFLKRDEKEVIFKTNSITNKLQELGNMEWVISGVTGIVGAIIAVLAFIYR